MPSIEEAVNADRSGYGPPKRPVLSPGGLENRININANRRFILPPFGADTDSVRQFLEDGNPNPKIRVWPVPPASNLTTIINNAASSASSDSSSSSSTSSGIAIKTATLNTGLIDVASSFVGSVAIAKSFQLISLTSTEACEIRMYGTDVVQSFDLARLTDDPVPAEIIPNIITDVIFDTLPYSWQFQSIVAANQSTPQTTTIYVTVINTTDSVLTNVTVNIGFVPLEA